MPNLTIRKTNDIITLELDKENFLIRVRRSDKSKLHRMIVELCVAYDIATPLELVRYLVTQAHANLINPPPHEE